MLHRESLICSLFRSYAWSGKHAKALIKAFNEIRDLFNNQVWTDGADVGAPTSHFYFPWASTAHFLGNGKTNRVVEIREGIDVPDTPRVCFGRDNKSILYD
ncbi:hypothetical protein GWI33_002392 [Rhynchophorus ferrugineus]|uniref:Uncharacterized protein n=1 Tax=Rhynchophorus ferrugineus TaxID=354439 RepID=A0A834IPF5_RHYFE|nr:hypothetical protein GWI33_002392 [Rhynchophorus ferrugineus]